MIGVLVQVGEYVVRLCGINEVKEGVLHILVKGAVLVSEVHLAILGLHQPHVKP